MAVERGRAMRGQTSQVLCQARAGGRVRDYRPLPTGCRLFVGFGAAPAGDFCLKIWPESALISAMCSFDTALPVVDFRPARRLPNRGVACYLLVNAGLGGCQIGALARAVNLVFGW